MKTRSLAWLACLGLGFGLCLAAGASPGLVKGPCPAEIDDPEGIECGFLVVPETRGGESARDLMLAYAIVKAKSPTPRPDPVVFLHGGPGGQIVKYASGFASRVIVEERDLIVLDQRGTGLSRPPLCPELSQQDLQPLAADLDPQAELARRVEIQLACRDRLVAEDFDLGAYNSDASAADLEDLRRALGIEEWNVFGVSYGTKLALTLLRHTPDPVRSVILDSAYPPGAESPDTRALDFARALQELHEGCAADPACHARYPDVTALLGEMVAALRSEPILVPIGSRVPVDEGSHFAVNSQDALITIQQGLYDHTVIPALPFLMSAMRDRDVEAMLGLIDSVGRRATGMNRAVYNTVECYERFPFWNRGGPSIAGSPWEPLLEDFVYFEVDYAVCAEWVDDRAGPEEAQPVASDVPALVLAGEYDPITPPTLGRQTVKTLSRGRYVEFPHIGHGAYRSGECPRDVVMQFLTDPSAELDTSCIAEMESPRFVTNVQVRSGIYRLARDLMLETRVARVGAAACLALLLLAPSAGWGVSGWRRRRLGVGATPSATPARWALGLAAALALGFFLALALAIGRTARTTPVVLAFGLPGEAAPIFLMPWAVAALTVAGALATPAALRAIRGTQRSALFVVALVGCTGFLAFCLYYGLF